MDFNKFAVIHEDDDLFYFDGIAIQKDRTQSVEYGEDYFEKYIKYEGSSTSNSLNASRVAVTEKYCKSILDIGIGSGEFIKSSKIKVYGFDINELAVKWLKFHRLYANPYKDMPDVEGLTFWDSLEHFPEPQDILKIIRPNQYAFISIPIISNILKVKENKHYRPNEHYYYFTMTGLISYMKWSGFKFIEHVDAEIKAGRKDIVTFVFQRQSLPT